MNESYKRVAMISDFFYPNVGGVEGHIYEVSQCLLKLGHSVIIITHAYGDDDKFCRQGVRYFKNCLKVYYIPIRGFYNQCSFPTVYCTLPIIREILIREEIDIIHAHSAFSALSLESVVHARTLGVHSVFTDHSLFGFADLSSVLMNTLLEGVMRDVDNVICVSNTSKENTVLRSKIDKSRVYVIPNAIHGGAFEPDPDKADTNFITVIVISRLVYRKGIDILCAVMPSLCQKYSQLRFVIAGDGPKQIDIEEMREHNDLYSRIELVGSVANHKVRDILNRGQIFISSSLTEAFCIAIVEAACCGLKVVATDVGGVSEVLPDDIIYLCKPNKHDMYNKLVDVIEEEIKMRNSVHNKVNRIRKKWHDFMWAQHEKVISLYTWLDVAQRTEKVYQDAMLRPSDTVYNRLKRHSKLSLIGGKFVVFFVLLEILFCKLLNYFRPAKTIHYLAGVRKN